MPNLDLCDRLQVNAFLAFWRTSTGGPHERLARAVVLSSDDRLRETLADPRRRELLARIYPEILEQPE